MIRWLPPRRTATNPFRSRIRQTSLPERTRSYPTETSTCVTKISLRERRATSDGSAASKNRESASAKFALASSIEEPWLAMSSSGQSDTNPSSFRSIMAVKRRGCVMIRVYTNSFDRISRRLGQLQDAGRDYPPQVGRALSGSLATVTASEGAALDPQNLAVLSFPIASASQTELPRHVLRDV